MKPRLIQTVAITLYLVATQSGQCLAEGNVLAYLGPDRFGRNLVLTILGDHDDNEICIIEDRPGHVRIAGLNGTTVNGQATDELSADTTFLGALVDLGNGDDAVEYVFTGGQYGHSLDILTGNGNDQVGVTVSGRVGFCRIDTGMGDDTIFFEADNSNGGLPQIPGAVIATRQGNDDVYFGGYVHILTTGIEVYLGKGDDILVGDSESNVEFPRDVVAYGGEGYDAVLNAAYFRFPYAPDEFETVTE